jgi:hypothetical protein
MTEAAKVAANENQTKMCENYTEHFKYGDVNVHKESQENWI